MKKGNVKIRQLVATLLTICMVLGMIPGNTITAFAAGTFQPSGTPPQGSIQFNLTDNGTVTTLSQYRGTSFTGGYCTAPDTKWWIEGKGYRTRTVFSSGTNGISNVSLGAGTYKTSQVGNTTTADVTWEKDNIVFRHGIVYTDGSSYFEHQWEITNKTGQPIKDAKLYQGGHHQLGGSTNGWGNYIGLNDMVYTWMNNISGMTYLRGNGGTNGDQSSHHYADDAYPSDAPEGSGVPYKYNMPDRVNTSTRSHAGYYLQWDIANNSEPKSPGYGRELAHNESYMISALEGIAQSGFIMIIPDGDIRAPQGSTVPHTFTLYNIHNTDITVNLSLSGNSWDSWFDGKAIGEGLEVTVPANSDKSVPVYVTIPNTASDNDNDSVILKADYTIGLDPFSVSESVNTIADSTAPYISNVTATNTRTNLDVKIDYENMLPGSHDANVEIFYGDGHSNSGASTGVKGSATIPTGGSITGINVSALPEGEYVIRATVKGIPTVHNTTRFWLSDAGVIGYVWRDINNNGVFDPFEGVSGTTVNLVPTGGIIEQKASQGGGVVRFGSTINDGGEYKIYPTISNNMYAVERITASVDGIDITSNIVANDNNTTFEYFKIDDSVEGTPAISYKFQPGKKTTVEFKIKLTYAAVLSIKPHLAGSPTSLVSEGSLSGTYGTSNLGPITLSQANPAPYNLRVPAGVTAAVTYSAPLGYRMANGDLTATERKGPLPSWYPGNQEVEVLFPLIKGDLRLTGIENTALGLAATSPNYQTSAVADLTVDSSFSGLTGTLQFVVHDQNGPVLSPNRSEYTWNIDQSKPNTLLDTLGQTTGMAKFKSGVTSGEVTVEVIKGTLSHKMKIVMNPAQTGTYTEVYFADPNAPNTPLDYIDVAALGKKDVIVMGVDANGTREKILGAAITPTVGDPSKVKVEQKPADQYLFEVTGKIGGETQISPQYAGATSHNTKVLVTNAAITGNTKIHITPNPVELTSGDTKPLIYTLYFSGTSGGNDQVISADFVEAVMLDASKASLNATGSAVSFVALGTTQVTAKLKTTPTVTGSAQVQCKTGGGAGGVLTIEEVTLPLTNGFIEVDGSSEYEVKLNGQILQFANVNPSSLGGKFTVSQGTTADRVKLTGVSSGVDKLTVSYQESGITYTGEVDIVVYGKGYNYKELRVTPSPTVIAVGEVKEFTVAAVFAKAGAEEVHRLPSNMYKTEISNSNGTIQDSQNNKNKVKGVNAGETELTAKAPILNQERSGLAKILVVAAGTILEVSPSPMWIPVNGSEQVTYNLNPAISGISGATLLPYITANIQSNVATFGQDISQVNGMAIGKTTMNAQLIEQSAMGKTVTIYVWNNDASGNGLCWTPGVLNLNSGGTGQSQVVLADTAGNPTSAIVNLIDLVLLSANQSVASIPANAAGTNVTVAAGIVVSNTSTTINAKSKAASNIKTSPDLDVNVNVGSGGQVNGLVAAPTYIELWPGETKEVMIKDSLSGTLSQAQLQGLLPGSFTQQNQNSASVNTAGTALSIAQTPGTTAGVNKLTVSLMGESAEVYIINYTEDPTNSANKLSMELNPELTTLVKDGALQAVTAKLVMRKAVNDALVDSIDLPWALVNVTANGQTGYTGAVAVSENAATTLDLKGITAGAAAYRVTYKANSAVTANGKAFVYAQDPSQIQDFVFIPASVVLSPNDTVNLKAQITYANGVIQNITGTEFPVAVKDLGSNDDTIATVDATGRVKAMGLGGAPAKDTFVTGTLRDTTQHGRTDVLVADSAAKLNIQPNPVIVDEGSTNEIQTLLTLNSSSYAVSNIFLGYTASNSKISLAAHGSDPEKYEVTGVTEGSAQVAATLNSTGKSTNTSVVVLKPQGPGDYSNYALQISPNPRLVKLGETQPFNVTLINNATGTTVSIPASLLSVTGNQNHCEIDTTLSQVKGINSIGYDEVILQLPISTGGVVSTVIEGKFLVITHGSGAQTINIDEDPVLYSATTQTTTGTVNFHSESQATVLWVSTDSSVANVDGIATSGSSYQQDVQLMAPNATSTVNLTWSTGTAGPLTAYVLESGNQHTVAMMKSPMTISSLSFEPDAVSMLVGDVKRLEELRPFIIKLVTPQGQIPTTLQDFKIVSGGGTGAAAKTTGGTEATQPIEGMYVNAETLTLQHKYASNASSNQKTVTVHVRAAAPIEILYYKEDGMTRIGVEGISLAMNGAERIIPKYLYSDGTIRRIPMSQNPTEAPEWTFGSNVSITPVVDGGDMALNVQSTSPHGATLDGKKITTYIPPGPQLDVIAEGRLNIRIREGNLNVDSFNHAVQYTVGDTAGSIAGDVTTGATGATGMLTEASVLNHPSNGANTYPGIHGTLVLQSGGSYIYTPNSSVTNQAGTVSDSFTYQIRNGANGEFARGTITIVITVLGSVQPPGPGPQYTVTYNGNGAIHGTVPVDSAQYAANAPVSIAGNTGNLVRDGYIFDGWKADNSGAALSPGSSYTITNHVTFYAVWTPDLTKPYEVTYDGNGNTSGDVPSSTRHALGENVTVQDNPNNLKKTGSAFLGWGLDTTGTGTIYGPGSDRTNVYQVNDHITLFAVWGSGHDLTVVAGANGSVDSTVNGTYAPGTTITLAATPDSGYHFSEWTSNPSGAVIANANGQNTTLTMPAEDVIITATFAKNSGGGGGGGSSAKDPTLTFDVNGGKAISSVTKPSGTVINLKDYTTTKAGYTFEGWYKESGLTTKITSVTLNNNTTVYAKWEKGAGEDETPLGNTVDNTGISGLITDDHFAYINGYPDGTVGPNKNMLRSEAAQMFYNLLSDKTAGSENAVFNDVNSTAWYNGAVTTLASKGIITGYTDGSFNPNGSITRAEFSAMASRFGNLKAGSVSFNDVAADYWGYDYIVNASARGWVNGYEDGSFKPNQNITRAEVIKLTNSVLSRFADKAYVDSNSGSITQFSDLAKSHWAYYSIMEATNGHDFEASNNVETWTKLK